MFDLFNKKKLKKIEEEKETIEYFDYQIELAKKEIEKHKEDEFKGNGTLEDIAKMQYCNLVKIKNLIEKLQKENKKQGKVIVEMINHIEHTCYYQDDYGNSCDVIQDTCVDRDKDCKECIKQYFYRKAENENV